MKFFNTRGEENTYKLYKEKPLFSKADIIVLSVVLIIIVLAILLPSLLSNDGAYAEIYIEGKLVAKYPLDKNRIISLVNGHISAEIKDGKIGIIASDCPDKICVHTGFISKTNERIVCAPYKLVIVISGADSEFDAVTGNI